MLMYSFHTKNREQEICKFCVNFSCTPKKTNVHLIVAKPICFLKQIVSELPGNS
jgi:hypothetical protein